MHLYSKASEKGCFQKEVGRAERTVPVRSNLAGPYPWHPHQGSLALSWWGGVNDNQQGFGEPCKRKWLFRAAQSSTGKALGEGGVGVARQHAGRGARGKRNAQDLDAAAERQSQAAVEPGAPAKEAQAA